MFGLTQLRLAPKTAPCVFFFFFLPSSSSSVNQEYPTLTTFFAGEIISRKRPFLTRKWDADEDVDRKHWVGMNITALELMKSTETGKSRRRCVK